MKHAGDGFAKIPAVATILKDLSNAPLGLSKRSHNALMRRGLGTLGDIAAVLEEFESHGVISVRNLGRKGIEEVRDKTSAYLATHLGKLTSNAIIDLDEPIVGNSENDTEIPDSAKLDNADVIRWQGLVEALANEVDHGKLHSGALLGGQPVSEVLKTDPTSIGELRLRRYCSVVEIALDRHTISEELEELFVGSSAIQIDVFFHRADPWKKTLEAIGHKRNLTRERVRQIEDKIRIRVNERLLSGHYIRLQSALLLAQDMGNKIIYSTWVKNITESGMLGIWKQEIATKIPLEFKPADLLIAVSSQVEDSSIFNRFRLPENLRTAAVGKSSRTSPEDQILLASLPKKSLRFIRKDVRNGGAVHVSTVAKRLSIGDEDVRTILTALGFQQATLDWYILKLRRKPKILDQQWAAFHTVLKILKYCGPLDMKEIWRGVRGHVSRRGYVVPPASVLLQALASYGFKLQEGNLTWQHENPSVASTSEKIILQEIQRIGPVVSYFDLSQAFLDAGQSIPALSNTLSHSPLFAKIETGLYELRGSVVTQLDIQRAEERQPYTAANSEILYDPSGVVRLSLNLGNLATTSGAIYSSHVPNLAGDWPTQVGEVAYGTVHVHDKQLWGLSKLFRAMKAQVGDRIEIGFDTWKHVVTIAKVKDES